MVAWTHNPQSCVARSDCVPIFNNMVILNADDLAGLATGDAARAEGRDYEGDACGGGSAAGGCKRMVDKLSVVVEGLNHEHRTTVFLFRVHTVTHKTIYLILTRTRYI